MSESFSIGQNTNLLHVQKTPSKAEKIKSAQEYEEMFMKFLFNNIMPKHEDGYLGNSSNSDIYRSFWIDAAAKQAAKQGVGIAKQILKYMERAERSAEFALREMTIKDTALGE